MLSKIHLFLISCILIGVSGCISLPDSENQKTLASFNKLQVSDSFNWETSRNVTFHIKSDIATVVSIKSEDGAVLYHQGFYSQLLNDYIVPVNLPSYVQKVLVNSKEVLLTADTMTIDLSDQVTNGMPLRSAQIAPISGLLASWSFNESSGTVATDETGLHTGTIFGTTRVVGVKGIGLKFNGISDHILVTGSTFNPLNNQLSFSFWFKLTEAGAGGTFISQNEKFKVRIDPQGKLSFALYTPVWKSIVMAYSDRILDLNWHHVAATYDGSVMKLFVDGVLKASDLNTGNLHTSTADVYIGQTYTTDFFKGFMDEMQVYEKTLTLNEINQLYTTTPDHSQGDASLLSYWPLDDNSGLVATDVMGNSNGVVSSASWATGAKKSCLDFNGTSSNVNLPNVTVLNPSTSITMMAWVKTRESKSAKIFEKGDWDGHGLGQDKWNGWQGSIRTQDGINHTIAWNGGVPVLNVWYHLAMTYDGETLKLYVNGQLKNSVGVTGKLNVNARNLSIGSDNASQKFFNGMIDDVKIFGTALSQTEIQSGFQNQVIVTDKDGDGVADSEDLYPNDPSRAFHNYVPAAGFGSLAFEDLWPNKGDYDFNDLIVDYRFTIVTNTLNKVTEVLSTFVVRAIGAAKQNGFGFQFPNASLLNADVQVEGSVLKENYISLNSNGTEANQDKVTIIAFDNVNKLYPSSSEFGVNVVPGGFYAQPDTTVINIGFTPNKYEVSDLDLANFNPFLIVNKTRGKEIHLPNYAPTSLVNQSYFGTGQDHSDASSGRYYKTVENLPWAIKVASSYDYTVEGVLVTNGYLKFKSWVESSGVLFPDWYLNKANYRNGKYIYTKP
jgi:LruC domain-containing protein